MFIERVYEQLRNNNVVSSAYQFSKHFLGKSPSYYSVIKAKQQQPTITVLLTLEHALEHAISLYSGERIPYYVRTRNNLMYLQSAVKEHRESKVMELFLSGRAQR